MRAAVATLLALSLSTSACFQNSKKHSSYAKVTEGGLMLAGVITLAVVNTTADCDADAMIGMEDELESCRSKANLYGAIGLGALLIGLVGFIVTVSVEPDDDKAAIAAEPKVIAPPVTTTAPPPAAEPPPVSEPAPATEPVTETPATP